MKRMHRTCRFKHTKLISAFASLAAGSLCLVQAETFTNRVFSTFDTSTDPFANFIHWWGGDIWSVTWDGTQNCPNTNAASGSGAVKVTFDWTDTSPLSGFQQPQLCLLSGNGGGGWNIAANGYPASAVMGYYYDLDFDIKFDPNSARSANDGTFGKIQAGVTVGWGQSWLWTTNYPATNTDWTHVHCYVNPTLPGIDAMGGFALILPWQTTGSGTSATNAFHTNATQVTTFWLDNIIYNTNLTKPLNPPTLALKPLKPTPGLNFQTASTDDQAARESIATVSSSYSWAGASSPVTYSITIAKYPGTNYSGFQTHLFLASGAGGAPPGTEAAPDWNEPNCVFVQIQNNADGSGQARFMWKTNDPGANDMLWGQGTLCIFHDTNGVLGTWSFTFDNNTNVTITNPHGLTTNIFFPDAAAVTANFPQGGTVAYFGVQANSANNTGQGSVVTNIKLNGGGLTPINDNFDTGVLDTGTWIVRADHPSDISLVVNNVHWTLNWTLPDLHYQLLTAPSVFGPWADVAFYTNAIQSGSTKSVSVPDSELYAGQSTYFKMVKRTATKLQVLLPGESNAPGTLTGKSGTPAALSIATPFDLTVNACDDTWHIVNYVNDSVGFTSTDTSAVLPLVTPLVNGTLTVSSGSAYPIYFNTAGSWTVTATNATAATVLADGVSTPVTVH